MRSTNITNLQEDIPEDYKLIYITSNKDLQNKYKEIVNWLISIIRLEGIYHCRIDFQIGENKSYIESDMCLAAHFIDEFITDSIPLDQLEDIKILVLDQAYPIEQLEEIINNWMVEEENPV